MKPKTVSNNSRALQVVYLGQYVLAYGLSSSLK